MTYSIVGRDRRRVSSASRCSRRRSTRRGRAMGLARGRRRRDAVVHRPPLRLARARADGRGCISGGRARAASRRRRAGGFRQVGMMTADGRYEPVDGCALRAVGRRRGRDGWIAQANLVESPRVWEAMGEAFEATEGPLALRLHGGARCRQAEGGDWRGRGGAGIVVVPAEGERWERVIDLRVEEGDASLDELRRLLERALGYREANRATDGDSADGRSAPRAAGALRPAVRALRRGRAGPVGRGGAHPRRARGAGPALARLSPARVAQLPEMGRSPASWRPGSRRRREGRPEARPLPLRPIRGPRRRPSPPGPW